MVSWHFWREESTSEQRINIFFCGEGRGRGPAEESLTRSRRPAALDGKFPLPAHRVRDWTRRACKWFSSRMDACAEKEGMGRFFNFISSLECNFHNFHLPLNVLVFFWIDLRQVTLFFLTGSFKFQVHSTQNNLVWFGLRIHKWMDSLLLTVNGFTVEAGGLFPWCCDVGLLVECYQATLGNIFAASLGDAHSSSNVRFIFYLDSTG